MVVLVVGGGRIMHGELMATKPHLLSLCACGHAGDLVHHVLWAVTQCNVDGLGVASTPCDGHPSVLQEIGREIVTTVSTMLNISCCCCQHAMR